MAGEADAYLEAYNEAEKALIAIKMMADALAVFARSLQSGSMQAAYQATPSSLPTAEQIRELQGKARVAIEKARLTHSQVPHHLRPRLPEPDSLGGGRGRMSIDEPDNGYGN